MYASKKMNYNESEAVNAANKRRISIAFWFVDIILRTETNEVAIKVGLQHSIRF